MSPFREIWVNCCVLVALSILSENLLGKREREVDSGGTA